MKLTISQEGSSPITITVPNEVKREKYIVTTEAWEQETVKTGNIIDDIFASVSRESDPNVSAEGMPRLSNIKPFAVHPGKVMNRQVFVKTVDDYMRGQGKNIEKIKSYISAKGWENVGMAGLSKVPTLWTGWFKDFGFKSGLTLSNARKQMFEKEYDGLKILFVHTDNSNNSLTSKISDLRAFKDAVRGYLILSKPGSDKFFCKTITPIIRLDRADGGKSNYQTDVNVNK